jgi:hypothetical protein
MNLEDKHIDDLFRNAANQSSAPEYHSSYWKEMEGLLNDSKKRRKGLLFWSGFGGVMMIGLLSVLLLSISSEAKYNKVNLSLAADALESTNLNQLNSTTKAATEISNSVSVTSKKGVASEETNIAKEEISQQNNRRTTLVSVTDQNNMPLIEEVTAIDVEQLQLIPINLGFTMGHLSSAIDGQGIQLNSLSAQNPFRASLELGAGLSQVYDNSRSHPRLFNAAVKLDYKLNNFLFSTGLGVIVEQNPGITVSARAQVYGFGVTNFEHSLNYKTLVDVAIPFQAAYQSGKNTFGIGAQLRYLANSSMRFESKENGETISADNLSGLTTGLNPINVDAYAFYERSIGQKISLGLRITQQLTSRIANDNYFNNLDRTKTLNGQVYIKYALFNL